VFSKSEKMLKFISALVFFSALGNASANEAYPSLLDVVVGQPFKYVDNNYPLDNHRPTTQFRVPNYGRTQELYPEFQVTILNATNNVVVISAEAAMQTSEDCLANRPIVQSWIYDSNQGYKPIPRNESQLNSNNEIGNSDNNTYYTVECSRSYGPFWTLHLMVRGKKEDGQLKAAWKEFFAE
jgi:hypothetical protein